MAETIPLFVNGARTYARCRPDTTVLEWLRQHPELKGTKEGCAEGDCGACSVLVGRVVNGAIRHEPANGCIVTMGQVAHRSLVTIEGLSLDGLLHPIQREMAKNGSSQCGFCTPGFVVALAALQERTGVADDAMIHDALAGNLCRCTGYRPIVEAAKCAMGGVRLSIADRLGLKPDELSTPRFERVHIEESTLDQPRSLQELVELRARFPAATLLAGGTDLNLSLANHRQRRERTITTAHVHELRAMHEDDTTITFGGAVTWQQSLPVLDRYYPSFATLVRRFGSPQIRSMGTIAGNLGTASPIGDGAPPLLALGASLTLASVREERTMAIDDFFVDYRKTALAPYEVIRAVHIPKPTPAQAFRVYKVSKRYDQDISTVCGAFVLTREGGIVTDAHIAFGGMAKMPLRCPDAEHALMGRPFTLETARRAGAIVRASYRPLSDARGTASYRSLVAQNLCERFAHDLAGERVEVMG